MDFINQEVNQISFMEAVDIVAQSFNQYLNAIEQGFNVTITPVASEEDLQQAADGILLTYKLKTKRPWSTKHPLEERSFLKPRFVNSEIEPGGLQGKDIYEARYDNIVEFCLYHIDYKKLNLQQEHFENFMIVQQEVFRNKNFDLLFFWERDEDKVLDIGSTKVYQQTLYYFAQTKQLLERKFDVIRKINIYVEELETIRW